MSTSMTEADWAHTLEVFRACLPRRGRKAANDRLFMEASEPLLRADPGSDSEPIDKRELDRFICGMS